MPIDLSKLEQRIQELESTPAPPAGDLVLPDLPRPSTGHVRPVSPGMAGNLRAGFAGAKASAFQTLAGMSAMAPGGKWSGPLTQRIIKENVEPNRETQRIAEEADPSLVGGATRLVGRVAPEAATFLLGEANLARAVPAARAAGAMGGKALFKRISAQAGEGAAIEAGKRNIASTVMGGVGGGLSAYGETGDPIEALKEAGRGAVLGRVIGNMAGKSLPARIAQPAAAGAILYPGQAAPAVFGAIAGAGQGGPRVPKSAPKAPDPPLRSTDVYEPEDFATLERPGDVEVNLPPRSADVYEPEDFASFERPWETSAPAPKPAPPAPPPGLLAGGTTGQFYTGIPGPRGTFDPRVTLTPRPDASVTLTGPRAAPPTPPADFAARASAAKQEILDQAAAAKARIAAEARPQAPEVPQPTPEPPVASTAISEPVRPTVAAEPPATPPSPAAVQSATTVVPGELPVWKAPDGTMWRQTPRGLWGKLNLEPGESSQILPAAALEKRYGSGPGVPAPAPEPAAPPVPAARPPKTEAETQAQVERTLGGPQAYSPKGKKATPPPAPENLPAAAVPETPAPMVRAGKKQAPPAPPKPVTEAAPAPVVDADLPSAEAVKSLEVRKGDVAEHPEFGKLTVTGVSGDGVTYRMKNPATGQPEKRTIDRRGWYDLTEGGQLRAKQGEVPQVEAPTREPGQTLPIQPEEPALKPSPRAATSPSPGESASPISGVKYTLDRTGKFKRTFYVRDERGDVIGRVVRGSQEIGQKGPEVWRLELREGPQFPTMRYRGAGEAPSPGRTEGGLTTKFRPADKQGRMGKEYQRVEGVTFNTPEEAVAALEMESPFSRRNLAATTEPLAPRLRRGGVQEEAATPADRGAESTSPVRRVDLDAPETERGHLMEYSDPEARETLYYWSKDPSQKVYESLDEAYAGMEFGPVPKGDKAELAARHPATFYPQIMAKLDELLFARRRGMARSTDVESGIVPRYGEGFESSTAPTQDLDALERAKQYGQREAQLSRLGRDEAERFVSTNPEQAVEMLGRPVERTNADGQRVYVWPDDPTQMQFANEHAALVYRYAEQRASQKAASVGTLPKADAPTSAGPIEQRLEARGRSMVERGRQQVREAASGSTTASGLAGMEGVTREVAGYFVIGTAKAIRGARDFASWSREMVEQFGEAVKPHLNAIWEYAQKRRDAAGSSAVDLFARIDKFAPESRAAIREVIGDLINDGVLKVPRPIRSFAQVEAEAADLIGTDLETVRKMFYDPKKPRQDFEVRAVARIMNKLGARIKELETEINGGRFTDQSALSQAVDELVSLNSDMRQLTELYSGERTRAGRNLAYFKITADQAGLFTDLPYWQRKIEQMTGRPPSPETNSMIEQILNQRKRVVDAMKEQGVPDREILADPKVAELNRQLARILAKDIRTPAWNAMANWYRANLLTSPVTHVFNQLSNASVALLKEAKDAGAAAVDNLFSAATGSKRAVAYSAPDVDRVMSSVGRGINEAIDLVKNGPTARDLRKLEVYMEQNTGLQALDAYVNYVHRLTTAGDRPWRGLALTRTLENLAKVASRGDEARFKVLSNPATTTKELLAEALMESDWAVSSNETIFSRVVSEAHRWANQQDAGWKMASLFVNTVLPFVRTPSALIQKAFEFSPMNLGWGLGEAGVGAYRLLAPRMQGRQLTPQQMASILPPQVQKRFAERISKGLIGTAIGGLGYYLASQGLFEGDYDPNTAATLEATGLKYGVVKLKDGAWFDLTRWGPVYNFLVAGARYADKLKELDERAKAMEESGGAMDAATRKTLAGAYGVASMLMSFQDQPMLEGLKNVTEAVENPEAAGQRFVGGVVAGMLPAAAASRWAGRVTDEVRREPVARHGAEGVMQYVQSTIPGLREKLPEKLDVLGKPVPEARLGGLLYKGPQTAVQKNLRELGLNIKQPRQLGWEPDEEFFLRKSALGAIAKETVPPMLDESSGPDIIKMSKEYGQDEAHTLARSLRDDLAQLVGDENWLKSLSPPERRELYLSVIEGFGGPDALKRAKGAVVNSTAPPAK